MNQKIKTVEPGRYINLFLFLTMIAAAFFHADAMAVSDREFNQDVARYWELRALQKKQEAVFPPYSDASSFQSDPVWNTQDESIRALIWKYRIDNVGRDAYSKFADATTLKDASQVAKSSTQRANRALEERNRKIEQATRLLRGKNKGAVTSAQKKDEGGISGWLIFIIIVAGIFFAMRGFFSIQNKREAARQKKRIQVILATYGQTQEERFQEINRRFDKAEGHVSHELNYRDTGKKVKATIDRALASMPVRERETLRALELMYNRGLIDAHDYELTRFALVWGDGKGIPVGAWDYHFDEDSGAQPDDITSALNWYAKQLGLSSEGAVNLVTRDLEAAMKAKPDNDLVQYLMPKFRGGSAWLTAQEMKDTIYTTEEGKGLHFGYLDGTTIPVNYAGEGSIMTIAPPGSGKTQCNVFPNLLTWQGPAVVLDVKGEIFAGTSKWRAENVGPVFRFSPLAPETSHNYNPLTLIRWEDDYIWEDARFLADMMIVPSGSSDPFWENKARDLLTAAIAYECSLKQPEERSMSSVIDIIHGLDWEAFMVGLGGAEISSMRRAGKALGDMDEKMRQSVFQQAQSSLSAWQGTRIERVTKSSDWSPLDLRNGTNPTIYICLKPNEVDSYISVLRVFISQHIRALTAELPSRDELVPILFMLDELPRLKQMPPVEEALEIGRQYGIRLWMFAQSMGQLKEAYKNADGMMGSCAVRIFMNPSLQDGTAKKIAEDLGHEETVFDASRKLMVEPSELAGPDYKDIQIVLAGSTKPAKVRKHFAYEDENIQGRMGSL